MEANPTRAAHVGLQPPQPLVARRPANHIHMAEIAAHTGGDEDFMALQSLLVSGESSSSLGGATIDASVIVIVVEIASGCAALR